jgi:hypothetical protein
LRGVRRSNMPHLERVAKDPSTLNGGTNSGSVDGTRTLLSGFAKWLMARDF